MKDGKLNYQAQVLRGEKWSYLMSEEEISKLEGTNSSIPGDVKLFLESEAKVKSKGKK